MDFLSRLTAGGVDVLSSVMVLGVVVLLVSVVVMFFVDVLQTEDAIRRNYPVIGRFRDLFSRLGEFFRQYFFAMDREELPFNRAEREWIYKSADGVDNTVAFGSTRSLTPPGTVVFSNCTFPTLEHDATIAPSVVIGPQCAHPYDAQSIINISAMSFGSLSKPAVQALSHGARKAGCWLNTGEGGLSPYHLEGGADIVFQIGTAKYGARKPDGSLDLNVLCETAGHDQVKMIELKLAQGAKPGKGGILPGEKVTPEIAEIRGIPPGRDSISPNRHPEIENNTDLLDMINTIRKVTGKPTGVKVVLGDDVWLADFCTEIQRRGAVHAPDFITVDSGDGGTGAAPMPLMDNVGLTIREALPIAVDVLVKHGLRDRIRIIASGKLVTPAEVAWAYCAGADFVASARGFMFALGCIQSLKCNKNTCPTGITTHDRRLQKGLDPEEKSNRVANFVNKMRYGVGLIAHSCGESHPRALERRHCRLVQGDGRTKALDKIFPNADILNG